MTTWSPYSTTDGTNGVRTNNSHNTTTTNNNNNNDIIINIK